MREWFNSLIGSIKAAGRFRWPALLIAWAICLIGWLVVLLLPNIYESHTRVFADTRTALGPVIQGLAIQQDVAAQLNLVTESLLGDAQLSQVLAAADLVDDDASVDKLERAREKLRDNLDISIEPSGDRMRPGGSIYWLSYRDRDRDRSLKVVEVLLNAFITDTVGGKLRDSEAGQQFLVSQINENERRLRDAESRLANFKKENVGTMPGAEGDYFTRLQNEIDANRKARTGLSIALSRRDELNRQLREGASAAAAASGIVAQPLSVDGRPVAAGDTAGRLTQARQELADLLTQYTDKHPAVGALRGEIADLERRRERELEALRLGDPAAVAATGASANPVYQSIQLALNQVAVEIASLRGEIGQREQKISELQRFVKTVPEVEAEYARLNRDYDVIKTQYLALLERLGQAKLGQDAEQTASGVKLQVLNPPTASLGPVSPNRTVLTLAVLVAGLTLGAVFAYTLSKLNPVFDHTRELEEATGRTVLGVVSLTTYDEYQAEYRRSSVRFLAAATGLMLVFLLALVVGRVAPDLLAIG